MLHHVTFPPLGRILSYRYRAPRTAWVSTSIVVPLMLGIAFVGQQSRQQAAGRLQRYGCLTPAEKLGTIIPDSGGGGAPRKGTFVATMISTRPHHHADLASTTPRSCRCRNLRVWDASARLHEGYKHRLRYVGLSSPTYSLLSFA